MKLAKGFSLLVGALILLSGVTRTAMAQEGTLEPEAIFFSHVYYDFGTGLLSNPRGGPQVNLPGDVYNNTNPAAPANFGFSSTDLGAQFGDRVSTIGAGVLQENDFTIFNSGTSAGPLLSATFKIELLNAASNALLGGYSTLPISFGPSGLAPGYYSIVTVLGLGGLNITVNTTDVLMRQSVVSKTGTANKLGIASLDPPSIGSSTATMYINTPTIGPAGYYNIGVPPQNANPGYRININAPVSVQSKSWGSVKALYH